LDFLPASVAAGGLTEKRANQIRDDILPLMISEEKKTKLELYLTNALTADIGTDSTPDVLGDSDSLPRAPEPLLVPKIVCCVEPHVTARPLISLDDALDSDCWNEENEPDYSRIQERHDIQLRLLHKNEPEEESAGLSCCDIADDDLAPAIEQIPAAVITTENILPHKRPRKPKLFLDYES